MAWLVRCLTIYALCTSHAAMADIIEMLVMPGKVVQSHQKYESDCKRCHNKLGSKSETKLCLDCHKRIATDVKYGKGFHGKAPGTRAGECRTCHTEHIGRKGDIVKFDPHAFNHNNTDFPLTGAHMRSACEACHKKKLKYRDAQTRCVQCHRKQNPHGSGLKKIDKKFQSCVSCHTTKHWQEIKFKHKQTDFDLTGKHVDVGCGACHKSNRFQGAPRSCYGCHKINDTHKGSQGKKCQNCHSSKSWKKITFDHARKTDFPLRGRHKKVDCNGCHKGDPKKEALDTACIECHRQDDIHTTRFGNKCEKCHSEKDWEENTFSHDTDTKFPLRGKHKNKECLACHKSNIFKDKLKTQCYSCHQFDDVHKSKKGKRCNQCHGDSGWSKNVIFEHDATKFPLMGLHAVTPCEECHLNATYESRDRKCLACHKKKDVHRGALGEKCQSCHTPNAWGIWVFDHNVQTEFKLEGKHKKLDCNNCHYKPLKEMTANAGSCSGCHAGDDQHRGQFGANCQRCHTVNSFQDIKDFH